MTHGNLYTIFWQFFDECLTLFPFIWILLGIESCCLFFLINQAALFELKQRYSFVFQKNNIINRHNWHKASHIIVQTLWVLLWVPMKNCWNYYVTATLMQFSSFFSFAYASFSAVFLFKFPLQTHHPLEISRVCVVIMKILQWKFYNVGFSSCEWSRPRSWTLLHQFIHTNHSPDPTTGPFLGCSADDWRETLINFLSHSWLIHFLVVWPPPGASSWDETMSNWVTNDNMKVAREKCLPRFLLQRQIPCMSSLSIIHPPEKSFWRAKLSSLLTPPSSLSSQLIPKTLCPTPIVVFFLQLVTLSHVFMESKTNDDSHSRIKKLRMWMVFFLKKRARSTINHKTSSPRKRKVKRMDFYFYVALFGCGYISFIAFATLDGEFFMFCSR